jgi:uracil-DNA glycosylase family 4
MSLNLDNRQRAMLREMGVRVWQPLSVPAPKPEAGAEVQLQGVAIKTIADSAHATPTKAGFDQNNQLTARHSVPVSAAQPVRQIPATKASSAVHALAGDSFWAMGAAQQLYTSTGADAEPARQSARWLVLAEVPAAALQAAALNPSSAFNAFDGDAGKLLDNMLRAGRLNRASAVHLVPLARHGGAMAGSASVSSDMAAALPALVAMAEPDVVLVMGRFAAQALLQTDAPFGKLRGQAHTLCGKPVVVTHDAAYLLRNQADKAKAWDDLRLAMRIVASPAG